jgi:16S rRNA (uracil1498-N3)-methyltransferase
LIHSNITAPQAQQATTDFELRTLNYKLQTILNLFYQPLIREGVLYLDEDESRHCVKVLRKNAGDPILITDGKGFFYEAVISKPDSRQCKFEIQQQRQEPPKGFTVHIALSPTKNTDRTEWFVEKSVELGIDRISLIDCKNSERSFIKTDRLKKVAVSALKQSLKATLPEITEIIRFDKFVTTCRDDHKFIAIVDPSNPIHLKEAAPAKTTSVVLIGPEGDFTSDELAAALSNGFLKVSLGHSRLRTETAGIAACHILNLINT